MNLALIKTIAVPVLQAGKIVGTQAVKHSPEILVGAGIVGGGITTFQACKATVKVIDVSIQNEVLNDKIDMIETVMDQRGADIYEDIDGKEYTREDIITDRQAIKAQTIMTYIKAYGPVVILGACSAASILCGFNIINRRNMALVAAYTSLERSFNLYRKRVIDEAGPDADWRYRTGAIIEKHEENVIDPETGEVKTKKIKGPVIKEDAEPVDYTINLGRECQAPFVKDAIDYTRTYDFLDMISSTATKDIEVFGWVSLNDIRRELYCPPVAIGQIAGWTRNGDGFVDLRPREVYDEKLGKNTIILDPNVDGAILDEIKRLENDPNAVDE